MAEVIDRYAGREPEGPAVQYSELWTGDWRTAPAYLEAERFWKGFLKGVDTVGELPADGGDPSGAAEGAGPARVRLPPEAVAAARQASAAAGVSEFAFYYAATLVLSGASLFVYLTQYLFRSALLAAGAPDWPLLNFIAALAGGVALWSAWTWTSSAVTRRLRRLEPSPAAVPAI